VKAAAMCKATCIKCLGNKTISAFSHIASGVCFMCGGTGVINADNLVYKGPTEEQKLASAAETKLKKDWLLSATPAQIAKLEFAQVCKARDFASACLSSGDDSLAKVHKVLMKRLAALC
jgi:hypothetical protein